MCGNILKAQCNLSFAGSVQDEDTKEKLLHATVRLKELGQQVFTDSLGKFVFRGLCAGHYDIEISHVGCQTLLSHIHIKDDFSQVFTLPHAKGNLAEVVVVGYGAKSNEEVALRGAALDALKGLSLGESMQKINGVSSLQTGTSIYKPVVNGLHSSRVVILNNGIRQEGQQWGGEHAPEIDTYLASKISLVSGASVLKYGGDAIGGLILVEPKLLRALPGIGAEINTAFFTNNRMGALSAIVDGASAKRKGLAWRLQATAKRGGNARTAGYWLDNSGQLELNASAAIGLRKEKWSTELFYSIFYSKLAIFSGAHIGNVTDLLTAINSAAPPDYIRAAGFTYAIDRPFQEVQHHLLKSKTIWNTASSGKMYLTTALQYNNRLEYDKKRFASSAAAPQLDLGLTTASLDLYWDHFEYKHFKGSIGFNSSYQMNQYAQRLFIPNYQAINVAAFAIEKWSKRNWTIEGGLRYDYRNFFDTKTNGRVTYADRNYNSLSSNFGIKYNVNGNFNLAAQFNSAWRAPNVNELYSDGLHHGAARIEKGDLTLAPERSNAVNVKAVYDTEGFAFHVNAYQKWISDFIFLSPTFPPQLTIRGAFPVFSYSQTKASLQGVDADARYEITHHIVAAAKMSLLYAKNKNTNEWLVQMPSNRYEADVTYSFNNTNIFKQSSLKLSMQHVAQQKRVPTTGAIELQDAMGNKYYAADYILPPNAYTLFGIEMASSIKVKDNDWGLVLVVSNVLNKAYREYLNAFRYFSDDAGRNISIKIKIPIN